MSYKTEHNCFPEMLIKTIKYNKKEDKFDVCKIWKLKNVFIIISASKTS